MRVDNNGWASTDAFADNEVTIFANNSVILRSRYKVIHQGTRLVHARESNYEHWYNDSRRESTRPVHVQTEIEGKRHREWGRSIRGKNLHAHVHPSDLFDIHSFNVGRALGAMRAQPA